MDENAAMAGRLEEVVRALRVLASTQRSDDARTIADRSDAVRIAAAAFEDLLVEQCISYTSVFAEAVSEDDFDNGAEDDQEGGTGLPAGTRLSVRVREDFVLVDERAFRESALRAFAEKGRWPSAVHPDDVVGQLGALVHQIGLHEITFGTSLAGLQNTGGHTEILVVDAALQEEEDW